MCSCTLLLGGRPLAGPWRLRQCEGRAGGTPRPGLVRGLEPKSSSHRRAPRGVRASSPSCPPPSSRPGSSESRPSRTQIPVSGSASEELTYDGGGGRRRWAQRLVRAAVPSGTGGPGPGWRLDRGSGQGPAGGASSPRVCWAVGDAPLGTASWRREAHVRLALGLKPGRAFPPEAHVCPPFSDEEGAGAPHFFLRRCPSRLASGVPPS